MQKNKIVIGAIGTLIEWAEFCFYGYMVFKFSLLFFPMFSHEHSLIAGFATFAISYLARPLGSLLFGHIGDRAGRQKALIGSLLLMGVATLGIGLLPTYAMIGNSAPLLLILCRFLQGLAMAGEYTGAAIFLIEHDPKNTYLSASWISTTSAAGMVIGGVFGILVSLPAAPVWAWRVPFCLGAISCLIGFYCRYSLSETHKFTQLQNSNGLEKLPIATALKYYKVPIIKIASVGAFIAIYVYICNIWWISFVIKNQYFTSVQANCLATAAEICVVIFTPLMAFSAQKMYAKRLMNGGMLASIFVTPLLFYVSVFRSIYAVFIVFFLYALSNAAVGAVMFKYFSDLLPVNIRYTAKTTGWNLGASLFGGSAPLIAQILYSVNLTNLIIVYVIFSALTAFLLNNHLILQKHKNHRLTEIKP
jgi:MHS family proline/betaine transporter-like MFS transporter